MRIKQRRLALFASLATLLLILASLCFFWNCDQYRLPFSAVTTFTSSHLDSVQWMIIDKENPCGNRSRPSVFTSKLLVICISAPDNFAARSAIRETWGLSAKKNKIPLFFFLGFTENLRTQERIEQEDFEHEDILQAYFHDSYYNLTLKSISMMHWVAEQQSQGYCSDINYVLKVDDDMLLNMVEIANFARTKPPRILNPQNSRMFIGKLARRWRPVRNRLNKYYCPLSLYSKPFYPNFVTGPAYLFTPNIAQPLYEAAIKQPEKVLFLEDVFMTGILAQNLTIDRRNHFKFFNRRVKVNKQNFHRIWTSHQVKPDELRLRWRMIHGQSSDED